MEEDFLLPRPWNKNIPRSQSTCRHMVLVFPVKDAVKKNLAMAGQEPQRGRFWMETWIVVLLSSNSLLSASFSPHFLPTLCIHDSRFLYFYWNSSFYATFEYLCMNNDLYCRIHSRALNTLFSSSMYLRAWRYLSLVQDWNNGICCTLLNTLNCLFSICHPRLAGLMFSFFATSHSEAGTPQDAQVAAGRLGGFPLS